MTDTKQERKVISSKARGYKWEKAFFMEIQDAVLDGWKIADNDKREDTPMRNFRGLIGRVVFYRDLEDTNVKDEKTEQPTEPEVQAVKPTSKAQVSKAKAKTTDTTK